MNARRIRIPIICILYKVNYVMFCFIDSHGTCVYRCTVSGYRDASTECKYTSHVHTVYTLGQGAPDTRTHTHTHTHTISAYHAERHGKSNEKSRVRHTPYTYMYVYNTDTLATHVRQTRNNIPSWKTNGIRDGVHAYVIYVTFEWRPSSNTIAY